MGEGTVKLWCGGTGFFASAARRAARWNHYAAVVQPRAQSGRAAVSCQRAASPDPGRIGASGETIYKAG